MEALLALGTGVVMVCYFLSILLGVALPGPLLLMAIAVLGLPPLLRETKPSRLGGLPQAFGCLVACAGAAWLAWEMWARAAQTSDLRLAGLLYALGALMALAVVATFRTGSSAARASSRARGT